MIFVFVRWKIISTGFIREKWKIRLHASCIRSAFNLFYSTLSRFLSNLEENEQWEHGIWFVVFSTQIFLYILCTAVSISFAFNFSVSYERFRLIRFYHTISKIQFRFFFFFYKFPFCSWNIHTNTNKHKSLFSRNFVLSLMAVRINA